MFCIKSSFADCLSCNLLDAPSCILETNAKSLDQVEVVVIAENPGKTEIEKEIPLCGKAGKTFRKYFDKYVKKDFKWLLTNVVLCATINPDGTTGNPDEETIEKCKVNCFKIIDDCKPKLIVLMGASSLKAFGIATNSSITNIRGQVFKWNGYNVLVTLHPSYINRQRSLEDKFEEDIKKIAELLGKKFSAVEEKIDTSKLEQGVHHYKIPDKFYTNEYKLIDVQFLNTESKILYIFRNSKGEKIFHTENDDYVYYKPKEYVEKKKVLDYNDLYQVKIKDKQRYGLDAETSYEGDVKLAVKHTMDYYLQKKEDEPEVPLSVLYTDIETYNEVVTAPNPEEAKDTIVMITFKFNGVKTTYVVDPREIIKGNTQVIKEDEDVVICKTEKKLLQKSCQFIRKTDPDILTGYYSNFFDFPYIINRCKKNGIDPRTMSKFNQVSYDSRWGNVDVAGLVVLDMIELYKTFTQNKRESYSLNFISKLEIKDEKLETSSGFAKLYREDVNRGIEYNIHDVDLLDSLNNKLKHIQLQDELRKICKASYGASRSPMGQLDSLLVSFLKEKGLSSQNAVSTEKSDKFEGAFVKEPITGIHDCIVDFDFTSLYPSIIMTLNIGVNTFVMKLEDYTMGYYLIYDPDKLPEKISVILNPINDPQTIEVNKQDLLDKIKEQDLICSINGCFFKKTEKSYYSQVLEGLISSRKNYKGMMFKAKESGDSEKKDLYNIRQLVYKVLSNALYGILGNKIFRFFNIDCARTITLTGQELIKTSILEANEYTNFIKTGKYNKPDVIDIKEMYGDLSRYTENVITADTDSVLITLNSLPKDKISDFEKIQKVCDEIQNYLNKKVIIELINKHNIFDNNKLELKNELIIKRGLYVSKKHYVNYVVCQEGVKTDEIVVMGLDTKRSDVSSLTKVHLNTLFDLILKSDKFSINKVKEFVKDIENEFLEKIQSGSKEIAKAASWGKDLKDYKTIPQGVRGMQIFNKLVYDHFNSGAKGYLFNIKGIDPEKAPKNILENYDKYFAGEGKKIDIIVLPEDEPRLPDYFIIDHKAMLEKSWKERYEIILKPLIEVEKNDMKF